MDARRNSYLVIVLRGKFQVVAGGFARVISTVGRLLVIDKRARNASIFFREENPEMFRLNYRQLKLLGRNTMKNLKN